MAEPLQPPDSFHLQAAEGWLELGNQREAAEELDKISLPLHSHPAVLTLRWQICAVAKDWTAALDVAEALTRLDSDEAVGWVHRSYSLHELKRTSEARDVLLGVVQKFPNSATMRYNLACYECQLGRLEEAKDWLRKAFALGNAKDMKRAALDDPDLGPLRKYIEGL